MVLLSQRMNTDLTNISFLKKNYYDLKIQLLDFSTWNHIFYSKKSTLPSSEINTLFKVITFHNILFHLLTYVSEINNINNGNFMEKVY